jgi:hypothetical protein
MHTVYCGKCRADIVAFSNRTPEESLEIHLTKACRFNPVVDSAEYWSQGWYALGLVRSALPVVLPFPKERDTID